MREEETYMYNNNVQSFGNKKIIVDGEVEITLKKKKFFF
jgi:hypothetical protein